MRTALDTVQIEHHVTPLDKCQVLFDIDPRMCKSRHERDQHTKLRLDNGMVLSVSERFWSSFSSLLNLNRSVFDYWEYQEVFERVTARRDDRVRLSYESYPDGKGGKLLACTRPTKPIVNTDEVINLSAKHDGKDISYQNGVASAMFKAPFAMPFRVGGDDFTPQFQVQIPLDGYGAPAAFISILRQVCTNGVIAMAPAFRTEFKLGKDDVKIGVVLDRAMTTFTNVEGYTGLRSRMENSTKSWASVREVFSLVRLLGKVTKEEGMTGADRISMMQKVDEAVGSPLIHYNLSSPDEMSQRKAASLPTDASVYDVLNIATEVSTHHLKKKNTRDKVGAWVGTMISAEYDLENTMEEFPDFKDFFDKAPKPNVGLLPGVPVPLTHLPA